MTNLKEIISRIQTALGDEAFLMIERFAYISAFQRVMENLSHELRLWYRYETYIPNPSSAPVDPPPLGVTIPSTDELYYTLRVLRDGEECYERTRESVKNESNETFPFHVNKEGVGKYAFYLTVNENNNTELMFSYPFDSDETLDVEYLSGNNYNPETIRENVPLPEFIADAVEYGMRVRIYEDLYTRQTKDGVYTWFYPYQEMKKRYQEYLLKAKAFSYNLRDTKSYIQARPLRWLGGRMQ